MTPPLAFPSVPGLARPGAASPGVPVEVAAPAAGPLPGAASAPAFMTAIA